jgi:hypothetical protein
MKTENHLTQRDSLKIIMPFGKYKGNSLQWIAEEHPDYIIWGAKNLDSEIRFAFRQVSCWLDEQEKPELWEDEEETEQEDEEKQLKKFKKEVKRQYEKDCQLTGQYPMVDIEKEAEKLLESWKKERKAKQIIASFSAKWDMPIEKVLKMLTSLAMAEMNGEINPEYYSKSIKFSCPEKEQDAVNLMSELEELEVDCEELRFD